VPLHGIQSNGGIPNETFRIIAAETGLVTNVSLISEPLSYAVRYPTTYFDPLGFFRVRTESPTPTTRASYITRYNYVDQPPLIVAPSTIGTDESNYIVSWSSTPSRQYKVQSTPDLQTPVWTDQSIFLSGTGATMSYAQPLQAGPIYFRVVLQ
jgi:hypothetical protein